MKVILRKILSKPHTRHSILFRCNLQNITFYILAIEKFFEEILKNLKIYQILFIKSVLRSFFVIVNFLFLVFWRFLTKKGVRNIFDNLEDIHQTRYGWSCIPKEEGLRWDYNNEILPLSRAYRPTQVHTSHTKDERH